MRYSLNKSIITLVITAILGACSFIVPSIIFYILEGKAFVVFPLNSDLFIFTQLFLITMGFIFCFMWPMLDPIKLGIASVSLMPIISMIEMNLYPYTHNLWPIEFVVTYPYLAVFGIIGGALGKFIAKKKRKPNYT